MSILGFYDVCLINTFDRSIPVVAKVSCDCCLFRVSRPTTPADCPQTLFSAATTDISTGTACPGVYQRITPGSYAHHRIWQRTVQYRYRHQHLLHDHERNNAIYSHGSVVALYAILVTFSVPLSPRLSQFHGLLEAVLLQLH
jgi:hypothetical protein